MKVEHMPQQPFLLRHFKPACYLKSQSLLVTSLSTHKDRLTRQIAFTMIISVPQSSQYILYKGSASINNYSIIINNHFITALNSAFDMTALYKI